MKTENINNPLFLESDIYNNFIKDNAGTGGLMIRAYAASEAIPIAGMKLSVSTIYDNVKIVFFEGETDDSGMIKKLNLPAPAINPDDLVAPQKTVYQIEVPNILNNTNLTYNVNMYDGVCVIQNINPVPNIGNRLIYNQGEFYGS